MTTNENKATVTEPGREALDVLGSLGTKTLGDVAGARAVLSAALDELDARRALDPKETTMPTSEANMTQTHAMAFALLFGDSHQAHLEGGTLGAERWYVRDHENENVLYTFEGCLRQLADNHDFDLRSWSEE